MASHRTEHPASIPSTQPAPHARVARTSATDAAAHQAFWLLRIGFTVAPILFGIDKFFNWSVYWPGYLAGWILDPQHSKPGARMPALTLSGPEMQAIVAYLGSLR